MHSLKISVDENLIHTSKSSNVIIIIIIISILLPRSAITGKTLYPDYKWTDNSAFCCKKNEYITIVGLNFYVKQSRVSLAFEEA